MLAGAMAGVVAGVVAISAIKVPPLQAKRVLHYS
jgi:hypothetical protein